MPVNYIICSAGKGSRFEREFPGIAKPLIKLSSRYLLDWSLDSLRVHHDDRIIIVTQKEHKVKDKLKQHLQGQYPFNKIEWLELECITSGQLETALKAKELIDLNSGIAIYNCDTYFQSKTLSTLLESPLVDGIIPCAQEPGDAWSFCKINDKDQVIDIAEKKRISDWVSVGLYYFKDAKLFIKMAEEYLAKKHNEEVYVAPFYQEYLAKNLNIVIDRVSLFKPMGSPEQIEKYWDQTIEAVIQENFKKTLVVDIDNTITIDNSSPHYSEKTPNLPLIQKLKDYRAKGYEIILFSSRRMRTCRNDESKVLADIAHITIEWLKQHGVPYDGIKFGKPYAENGFYIDDKAIRPDEFLTLSEAEIQRIVGMGE